MAAAGAILARTDLSHAQKVEELRQGWRKREADLSKFLSERNVETLRAEFSRRDVGLTKAEFVYVMEKCLVRPGLARVGPLGAPLARPARAPG